MPPPNAGDDGGETAFIATSSSDPDPTVAAAEVCGRLLEGMAQAPSFTLVAVSGRHRGRWDELRRLMADVVQPDRLVMVEADRFDVGALGGSEDAVGAWAARDCESLVALPLGSAEADRALLAEDGLQPLMVLAASEQAADTAVGSLLPGVPAVVGCPSTSGVGRFGIDDGPANFGVLLATREPATVATIGIQGVIPVTPPVTVTAADGHRLYRLADRSPRSLIDEVLSAAPDERALRISDLVVAEIVDQSADPDPLAVRVHRLAGGPGVSGEVNLDKPVAVGSVVRLAVTGTDAFGDHYLRWLSDADLSAVIGMEQHGSLDRWSASGDGELLAALSFTVRRCHGPLGPGRPGGATGWIHRGVTAVGFSGVPSGNGLAWSELG